MNNTYLPTLKVRVQHIVSYLTYSNEYQLKIVQTLVCERVLELIKGKENVTDEEITKIAKDLIFKHTFKFKRTKYDITAVIFLLDTLKKYNYEGKFIDRLIIEDIVKHALLEFPISKEEMEKTIIAIAQYEFDRQENTYDKFKEHLLKSKIMKKVNVPLKVFEIINERFIQEYATVLEEHKNLYEVDYNEIVSDLTEKEKEDVK